jgi:hypothetical protein
MPPEDIRGESMDHSGKYDNLEKFCILTVLQKVRMIVYIPFFLFFSLFSLLNEANVYI